MKSSWQSPCVLTDKKRIWESDWWALDKGWVIYFTRAPRSILTIPSKVMPGSSLATVQLGQGSEGVLERLFWRRKLGLNVLERLFIYVIVVKEHKHKIPCYPLCPLVRGWEPLFYFQTFSAQHGPRKKQRHIFYAVSPSLVPLSSYLSKEISSVFQNVAAILIEAKNPGKEIAGGDKGQSNLTPV